MKLPLLAVLTAVVAEAAVLNVPHVLHEQRSTPSRHWVKREALKQNAVLPMRIGMTQSNLEQGDQLLMEVADHKSDKYGQWYSAQEIVDLFAPSKETVSTIRAWLESAGIEPTRISQSANKQWMQFDASVKEAEDLLRTKYYIYEHGVTGRTHVACDEYQVPKHVQEHVDYITPGLKLIAGGKASASTLTGDVDGIEKRGFRTNSRSKFTGPSLKSIISNATARAIANAPLANCDSYITPACIATMYNITKATKAAAGNQLGIFEEGDFYAAEDLVEFFSLFTSIPSTTEPKLEGIDGGSAPSAFAGGESDLDFQISYPIIYPQGEILFQTDDIYYAEGVEGGGGFLNTFFDAIDGSYCTYSAFGETGDASIDPKYPDPNRSGYEGQRQCGVYKPTNVISISYGEQEDDLPTNYQQRQCSEIMKLGMQGTSIVLASGDSGVAARGTDDGNSDGCLGTGQVFNPDFPASCPYVTALGATVLYGNVTQDQESAVTRFPSGGGFSNIYAIPSYQNATIQSYFANHDPGYPYYSVTGTNNPTAVQYGKGVYNRAGRGYPDASAVGDNVLIFNNGDPTLIGGTSAAAPVFAAILNRINEERIAVGKSTVGFVNPTLYAHPEM
ncbi:MAG: hypothetical protein M1822_002092 [Bathelium mastoideum]|nr:MAG: hypothetical protein M1822_002092 [Bathelium mastoideum]